MQDILYKMLEYNTFSASVRVCTDITRDQMFLHHQYHHSGKQITFLFKWCLKERMV